VGFVCANTERDIEMTNDERLRLRTLLASAGTSDKLVTLIATTAREVY
jgi:hypothetical protein